MAEPIVQKFQLPVLEARGLGVRYGDFLAVTDVNFAIYRNRITAIIGPSGCGKTTLLRSFNRMNELVPGTGRRGSLFFEGPGPLRPVVSTQ